MGIQEQKIVFIQPRVGYEGSSYWDALGISYIISYLKHSGFQGEIEFYSGAFDSDETIIKACSDADFVGFGCTSPQLKHALSLARQIKEVNPNCKTVFGGWHPTADPKGTITHPEVDHVITGEGEIGTFQLVNSNRESKTPIINSPCFPNLDELPWPARETIKAERHINVAFKENNERITSVMGSRGCPMRCIFCSEHLMTKGWIRMRTPKLLVDEIEYVADKYRIDLLKFVDAEINKSVRWVKELCQELVKRNLDVEFEANIHASFVDKEMLMLMKKAGFRQIDIGVETGSPRILKLIRKGTTINQIKKVFKWSKEAGLLRRAYFMCGFPDERPEDVELTFKLAEELDADVYGMTILCPFPGTNVYSEKYKDVDWSVADEYGNPFYRTKYFSNEQLKEIQQRFTRIFKEKLCYRLRGK